MDEGQQVQQATEERRRGAFWVFAAGLGTLAALSAISVMSMRSDTPAVTPTVTESGPGTAAAVDVNEVAGEVASAADPAEDVSAGTNPAEKTDASAEQSTAAVPAPPTFDVVRLDPEGNAVVAGVARPGTEVQVLIDGAEAARATTGADGKFVALFSVPPDASARMVTLGMNGQDGASILSTQSVMLAPVPEPVVTAAAPEPKQGAVAPTAEVAEVSGSDADPAAAPSTEPAVSTTVVMLGDTPEETQVLQSSAAPQVQDHVSIDAIAYDDSGDVLIAGRGQADSAVRVYVDNKPLTTAPVTTEGSWRLVLPEVDSGIYTLRVDALDAEGNVTSRFETPFQREERAVAAEAVAEATAPPNPAKAVASRVTVQPGFTLWGIASANYGEGMMYVQLYQANKDLIRDPDLIYPGQIFTVPEN